MYLCNVFFQARLDLGTDRLGYGYGGTGKKSNAKQFDDYGSAYGMNDVIGIEKHYEISFFY